MDPLKELRSLEIMSYIGIPLLAVFAVLCIILVSIRRTYIRQYNSSMGISEYTEDRNDVAKYKRKAKICLYILLPSICFLAAGIGLTAYAVPRRDDLRNDIYYRRITV